MTHIGPPYGNGKIDGPVMFAALQHASCGRAQALHGWNSSMLIALIKGVR